MHLLVDDSLKIPQLLLHAVRQGGVIEAQAEFDIAFLGAVGRGSAKSVVGGLMSGVVGVLVRVRRGPAGTMGSA